MSKVYFISDLHIGHENILKFSPMRYGHHIDQHDWWLVTQWNSIVTKQDTVYVLGDVAFKKDKLYLMGEMLGNKILIIGNHDKFPIEEYNKYFSKIHGFMKYKGYWLTHAPLHPNSLRGRKNIHGHLHQHTVGDKRYINVSVEQNNGVPIEFSKIEGR